LNSLSQIGFQNESENSVTSSCSSATSSGLGSTLRTVTWTPPHSIGTSTPTHTEGTPSITESSESGDISKSLILDFHFVCVYHMIILCDFEYLKLIISELN
jgi:hypothetical protein